MSRFRHAILPIAVIAVVGCKVGGSWDPTVVNSPLGVTVQVRNDSGTREAELLMVREDGLIILIDEEVRLSRWTDMTRLRIRRMPVAYVRSREQPDATVRDQLSKAARYPLGLTDEQFAELLSSFGQTEPTIHR